MRQITKQEWDEIEFIEVTTVHDLGKGRRFFLPGREVATPPDPPDEKHVYFLRETTLLGDYKRSWEWIPAMTDHAEVGA
jgi:hypothetical protein